jgi:hypothetical protein
LNPGWDKRFEALSEMSNGTRRNIAKRERFNDHCVAGFSSTQLWITVGAVLFLVALLISAILVPALRVLHSLQALIYVAVIVLAHRKSAWGFGAGVSSGIVWNALNIFVTHLMQAGATAFWLWLRSGPVTKPVAWMVALGGMGHFILIAACLFAMLRLNGGTKKWWQFVGGGAIAVAYFVLLAASFGPH